MKTIFSEIKQSSIRTFLRKYSTLIFWPVWGICMNWVFGSMLRDLRAFEYLFIGLGLFMGISLQFVRIIWFRRITVFVSIIIAVLVFGKSWVSLGQIILDQKISRGFLVDDVRQLASILELTHPDPYQRGSGKVAFNRRMQDLIRTIPEEGLTKQEFYRHICPLLASVGDGHTSFWLPFDLYQQSPGGIPLHFSPVDTCLYVAGVIDSSQKHLIGSKLLTVENIYFNDLLKRQAEIKGYDNEYQLMRYLGYDGTLWHYNLLSHLIPEWEGKSIKVVLEKPDSSKVELKFKSNTKPVDSLIFSETKFNLPLTEKSDYVYKFIDEEKKTALLLIENMYTYRESFEMEQELQGSLRKELAKHIYQKYNDASPPLNSNELVAGLPSATELCRELLEEMKNNQSSNLIIDLRRNQGGNAFISTIFYYFMYGKETLINSRNKKSIFAKKYSPLFWRQYSGLDINQINEYQPIELTETDYDFANYPRKGENLSREEAIRIIEDEASTSTTFWKEYQSEKYSGYYRPKNIIILCSPLTTSSGYAFMYDHWAAGGTLVGIPSSQAGNACGAWVSFKLNYSRLGGGVSHLYITHFRDNPELGKTFRPDYEITYDDLQSFDFDPNAEILFALRLIDSLKN